jgi:hypothetical protein
MPPGKREKLLNDVRLIVTQWRPFIDVFQAEMQKPPRPN